MYSSRGVASKPLIRPKIATQLQSQKKRVQWTPEEDAKVLEMKEDGCSWKEISDELPFRNLGAIQVRYNTKRSSSTGSRKRKR
jgi:hypothetical protein